MKSPIGESLIFFSPKKSAAVTFLHFTGTMKCKIKGCRSPADDPIPCCIPNCSDHVHPECVERLKTLHDIQDCDWIFCGKRCYNAKVKEENEKTNPPETRQRYHWHNDGTAKSQYKHSITLLLEWISTEPNYARWKGSHGTGETKSVLCSEISKFIKENGITIDRAPKEVHRKISALESSHRAASDWLGGTGQGVTNETDLRSAILSRCVHWDILEPIMGASDSVDPLFTENDIDSNSTTSITTDSGKKAPAENKDEEETANTTTNSETNPPVATIIPDSTVHVPEEDISTTTTEIETNSSSNSMVLKTPNNKRKATAKTATPTPTKKVAHTILPRKKKEVFTNEFMSIAETRLQQIEQENSIKKGEYSLREKEFIQNTKIAAAEVEKLHADAELSKASMKKIEKELEVQDNDKIFKLLKQRKELSDIGYTKKEIDLYLPLSTLACQEKPSNESEEESSKTG